VRYVGAEPATDCCVAALSIVVDYALGASMEREDSSTHTCCYL